MYGRECAAFADDVGYTTFFLGRAGSGFRFSLNQPKYIDRPAPKYYVSILLFDIFRFCTIFT